MVEAQLSAAFRVRPATKADTAAMIPVINAAFAVETFLDGTRTDETRMAEYRSGGEFLKILGWLDP